MRSKELYYFRNTIFNERLAVLKDFRDAVGHLKVAAKKEREANEHRSDTELCKKVNLLL